MKKSYLYAAWAVLYCVCVGVSFTPEPAGVGKLLLVATAVLFFVPPFLILYAAKKENNRKTLFVLRLMGICVLSLSLVLIMLNLMSFAFSAQTGLWLYVLLVLFSAPMVCGQYWALGLFLWACLTLLTFQKSRPDQK